MRKRLGAGILLASLATATIGVFGPPAYAVVPDPDQCRPYLEGAAEGDLTITTSPAAGEEVPAGTEFRVTATWDRSQWDETDKILVCVTADGAFSAGMSGGQRPMTNDGEYSWDVFVPVDTPVGTEICVRDVLFGMPDGGGEDQVTQKSGYDCLFTAAALPSTTTTTAAPATTTAPTTTGAAPQVITTTEPEVSRQGTPGPVVDVVLGEVANYPVPLAALPRTGSRTGTLVTAAALALGLGVLALTLGRRRPKLGER